MKGKTRFLALIVFLSTVSAVACRAYDSGALAEMPEAQIRYPNSLVVMGPRECEVNRDSPRACVSLAFVSADAPEEVRGFFEAELKTRGWNGPKSDSSVNPISSDTWTNKNRSIEIVLQEVVPVPFHRETALGPNIHSFGYTIWGPAK